MSMARREAKCRMDSRRWAGQNRPPVQRAMASPSRRTIFEPHTGHLSGILNLRAFFGRRDFTTLTISGMTSPARRTMTQSPMRTSRRLISSSLWRVALLTVTPPTWTGSSRATGVTAPVRPTCTSMSSTRVISSWAGNLWATAQRGARAT